MARVPVTPAPSLRTPGACWVVVAVVTATAPNEERVMYGWEGTLPTAQRSGHK